MLEILLVAGLCTGGATVCAIKSLQHGAEAHRSRSLRQILNDTLSDPVPQDQAQLLDRIR